MDHGRESKDDNIEPVVDTGVNKTLICEEDWVKMIKAVPKLKPKKCRVKFTPYGTKIGLLMIGRTKAVLTCVAGNSINTIVYIVKGAKRSLL